VNDDTMYRLTIERQRQLLEEAERGRVVRSAAAEPVPATLRLRPFRAAGAALLRRVADRLEPGAAQPQIRLLRR
jgi:hypothetical protein